MDQHPNPRVQTLPVQQSQQQVGSQVIFSRRTSALTGSVFGPRRTGGKKNAEREVFSFFFSILEEGWIEGPTKPQRIRYYWPVEIDTTGNWK